MGTRLGKTYVVRKLDEGGWMLYRFGDRQLLHEGGFADTWERAREIAAEEAPAQILAVNDDDGVVVQELYLQRPN